MNYRITELMLLLNAGNWTLFALLVYLSSRGDVDPTINPKIIFFLFSILSDFGTIYICWLKVNYWCPFGSAIYVTAMYWELCWYHNSAPLKKISTQIFGLMQVSHKIFLSVPENDLLSWYVNSMNTLKQKTFDMAGTKRYHIRHPSLLYPME